MTPGRLRQLADAATADPWADGLASVVRADQELIALGPDAARLLADAMDFIEDCGPHHPACDVHWNRTCDCGELSAHLLARFAALGEEQT